MQSEEKTSANTDVRTLNSNTQQSPVMGRRLPRYIAVLLLAFSAMLVLVGIVTWYGLINLKNVQTHIDVIVDNHIEKLIATDRMEKIGRMRISLVDKMTHIEDPFERDVIEQEVHVLTTKFTQARGKLLDMELTEEETKLINEQLDLIRHAYPISLEVIDLLAQDRIDEAAKKLVYESAPAQDIVMQSLEKLNKTQILASKDADIKAKNIYEDTFNGMLIMSGSAILLGMLIMTGVVYWAYRSNIERDLYLRELEEINFAYEKKAEELVIATDKANIASETKSAFLANMSHEIRTPLTAIIGYAEDMLDHSSINEQDYASIQTITRNGKHLLKIINEILDISKIESGKLETELLDVSLFDILRDLKSLLKLPAEEKGLSFDILYDFPIPEVIHTDPTRLKQILLNLSYNAIKFTQQGGVTIQISMNEKDNLLTFVVKDTGIGMSESQLDRIFNTFTQGDSSTTREFGGTGLGLCISKILAEILGGTITVESIPDLGSAFTVTIDPGDLKNASFAYTEIALPEPELEHLQNNVTPALSGSILLAEDTEDIQDLVTLLVEKTGASIDIADNGEIAVDKAMKNHYDLVLMDMQMPKMDGLEAIRILRDNGFNSIIVSLTANARKEDRENCKRSGCDDFLSKPIDRQEFYKMLGKYLSKGSQNDAQSVDNVMDEISRKFVAGLPEWLNEIKKAYTDDNNDSVAKLLHKMKGMGGSFGHPILTDYSRELEELLRQEHIDQFDKKFSEMEHEIKQIVSS